MNMRYGFVPISELVNMPMYAILTLLGYIEMDLLEEKKAMEKAHGGGRGIRKRLG
jgi:hypothetical protein